MAISVTTGWMGRALQWEWMLLSLKIHSMKGSPGKEVLPLAQDSLCLEKSSRRQRVPWNRNNGNSDSAFISQAGLALPEQWALPRQPENTSRLMGNCRPVTLTCECPALQMGCDRLKHLHSFSPDCCPFIPHHSCLFWGICFRWVGEYAFFLYNFLFLVIRVPIPPVSQIQRLMYKTV